MRYLTTFSTSFDIKLSIFSPLMPLVISTLGSIAYDFKYHVWDNHGLVVPDFLHK